MQWLLNHNTTVTKHIAVLFTGRPFILREGFRPGGILSVIGSIDVGGHGRRRRRACLRVISICLLYDLISAERTEHRPAARRRPSLNRLPDLDDMEIQVKRCAHARPVPPWHDCETEAYDSLPHGRRLATNDQSATYTRKPAEWRRMRCSDAKLDLRGLFQQPHFAVDQQRTRKQKKVKLGYIIVRSKA